MSDIGTAGPWITSQKKDEWIGRHGREKKVQ